MVYTFKLSVEHVVASPSGTVPACSVAITFKSSSDALLGLRELQLVDQWRLEQSQEFPGLQWPLCTLECSAVVAH